MSVLAVGRSRATPPVLRAAVLLVALSITACSGPAATSSVPGGSPSEQPSAGQPSPSTSNGEISGMFEADGRQLYLQCSGVGSPTIVLVAGHFSDHRSWNPIFDDVAATTRTCSYDRPNTGTSDAATELRTADDGARELGELLAAAGVPPPYLLVAHSAGGWLSRLYASEHPDDVVGIVLIDSPHEDFDERTLPLLSDAEQAEITARNAGGNEEKIDYDTSYQQVRDAAPLTDIPFVYILAAQSAAQCDADPECPIWLELAQSLVATMPQGRLVSIESGHFVHEEHPAEVLAEIATVLAQAQ